MGKSVPRPTMLVTGFGPFGVIDENPSGDAVLSVDGETVGGVQIIGRLLPVSWRTAWPKLVAMVEACAPTSLVMLGASDRPRIEIELTARNRVGTRADVDGAGAPVSDGGPIVAGGPAFYPSTLPVDAIEKRLSDAADAPRAGSVEVGRSSDAGRYLCNYIFYQAMHGLGDRVRQRGFVHVPPYAALGLENGVEPGPLREAIVVFLRATARCVGGKLGRADRRPTS